MRIAVVVLGVLCLGANFVKSENTAVDKPADAAPPAPEKPAAPEEPPAAEPVAEENPASDSVDAKGDEDYGDMDDDEFDDYYSWQDRIMNPVRNAGQKISDTVGGAANVVNDGVNAAADWWNGEDDYDYDDDYADDQEQVNAWWDKMQEAEYNYDDIDDGSEDENDNPPKPAESVEDLDDLDDYEEEDYDYYDLYNTIKYPKPEDSKQEAKNIHHPKDNKITMPRMRSRVKQPYSVDDYFDFVVIAMCVVLLFIMLLAGVSRYNNQQYLKKAYGRNSEKSPLIR